MICCAICLNFKNYFLQLGFISQWAYFATDSNSHNFIVFAKFPVFLPALPTNFLAKLVFV